MIGSELAEGARSTGRKQPLRQAPRKEAPALNTRVLFRRFIAFWMDFVLILLAGRLFGVWQTPYSTETFIGVFAVFFAYRMVCEAYAGRTFSKMLLRLRVIPRCDISARVGPWRSLVRNLFAPLDNALIGLVVGLVIPAASEGNRRLGDLAAGTLVASEGSLKRVLAYHAARTQRSGGNLHQKIVGEQAERDVARELARLSGYGPYYIFNNLPERRVGDIDHLVVGPCGLLVVETKANRGEVSVERGHVLVNGNELPREPVSQVQSQCKALQGRLGRKAGRRGVRWLICMPRATGIYAGPDDEDRLIAASIASIEDLVEDIGALDWSLGPSTVRALAETVTRTYGIEPAARPAR